MIQIVAKDFLDADQMLRREIATAGSKRPQLATEAERDALIKALIKVHHQCGRLKLKESVRLSYHLMGQIRDPAFHGRPFPKEIPLPSFEAVYWQLQGIADCIHRELDGITLALIPVDNIQFFERDDLFGSQVKSKASKELNAEIKAAGNSLAADLNTAAVFHLMCVAEHGLRRLARKLGVKTVKKSIPIELGTWSEVITALQTEVNSQVGRANDKQQKRLSAYSELLFEFKAFERFWRNKVMHNRASYSRLDARNAFEHVSRFMNVLATQVPLR